MIQSAKLTSSFEEMQQSAAAAEEFAVDFLEQIYTKSIQENTNKQQRRKSAEVVMDEGNVVSPTCLKHLPTISSQMLDNDEESQDSVEADYEKARESQDSEWSAEEVQESGSDGGSDLEEEDGEDDEDEV